MSMSGVELRDGELVVEREPNDLDTLAIRCSSIFDEIGIKHVYVAGYVAILTGRSRATKDIDVLFERHEDDTIEQLASRLDDEGLWGPAMPLDTMPEMLEDNIWIARDGEMVPHLEAKFVSDEFDRESLQNAIIARIAGAELPIGPLELQIAYKLWMRGETDFEDAIHLFTLFGESLRTYELEAWVEALGVEDEYERLKQA